jgi:hypothetical protein
MAARTFADSAGTVWEVFEVHRSSTKPGAVSNGLEQGWLSFTSGESKRRLAPIPPQWETSADPELERLCSTARVVAQPTHVFEPIARDRRRKEGAPVEVRDTGERRRAADDLGAPPPVGSAEVASAAAEGAGSVVEAAVRRFAHEARARGLAAIDAMVELKAMLQTQFPEPDSDARDIKSVRRWFVETYYFEAKR